MLRICGVVLEVLEKLQPALKRIEVRDRDLGRQLRRCSSSVALNLAEVAVVCRYIAKDAPLYDQLDRVVGTLVKLTRV